MTEVESHDTVIHGRRQVLFHLPAELKVALQEVLRREGKTLTDFYREVTEEYVKAHASGNPGVPLDRFFENPTYRACPTILTMEGRDWSADDVEDLRRYRAIMVKELGRINAKIPVREESATHE
jgi:hypothetical protein